MFMQQIFTQYDIGCQNRAMKIAPQWVWMCKVTHCQLCIDTLTQSKGKTVIFVAPSPGNASNTHHMLADLLVHMSLGPQTKGTPHCSRPVPSDPAGSDGKMSAAVRWPHAFGLSANLLSRGLSRQKLHCMTWSLNIKVHVGSITSPKGKMQGTSRRSRCCCHFLGFGHRRSMCVPIVHHDHAMCGALQVCTSAATKLLIGPLWKSQSSKFAWRFSNISTNPNTSSLVGLNSIMYWSL